MKWTGLLVIVAAFGMATTAWSAEVQDQQAQAEVFDVLEQIKNDRDEAGVDGAVDPLAQVVGKSRRGERRAVQSNLDYNRRKLQALREKAAAQQKYLETLWQRVAVQFEDLKAKFGNDENVPAYRKAAIALSEEYAQREAQARRELQHINEQIAQTEARIAELENSKKIQELEDDLRNINLAEDIGYPEATRPAIPSRAGKALQTLADLSKRKTQHRLQLLVGSISVRTSADDYFDRQIQHMLSEKGN